MKKYFKVNGIDSSQIHTTWKHPSPNTIGKKKVLIVSFPSHFPGFQAHLAFPP